jgi:hypothetical protein
MDVYCPVVELRQYSMQPGRRDELIELFEEHFIEGQERCGMSLLGQFRDAGDPDRFVWMRGFASMEARLRALEAFYGGAIWARHREAANATMVDSSDVLLLRPARAGSGLRLDPSARPRRGAPVRDGGVVVASIGAIDAGRAARGRELAATFEEAIAPALRAAGAALLGCFTTLPSENTFPRLPVREGEDVFVWLASFADRPALEAHRAALASDPAWTGSLAPALRAHLAGPEQVLELEPTRRSLLRHGPGASACGKGRAAGAMAGPWPSP